MFYMWENVVKNNHKHAGMDGKYLMKMMKVTN